MSVMRCGCVARCTGSTASSSEYTPTASTTPAIRGCDRATAGDRTATRCSGSTRARWSGGGRRCITHWWCRGWSGGARVTGRRAATGRRITTARSGRERCGCTARLHRNNRRTEHDTATARTALTSISRWIARANTRAAALSATSIDRSRRRQHERWCIGRGRSATGIG